MDYGMGNSFMHRKNVDVVENLFFFRKNILKIYNLIFQDRQKKSLQL